MTIVTLIFIFLVLGIFIFFNRLSNHLNVYDIPDDRKLHKGKISLAGGVYIFICIYLYLIFSYFENNSELALLFKTNTEIINFMIVSLSFFLIGLVDDKKNISANRKILFFFTLILIAVSIDNDLNLKILYFSFVDKRILLENFSTIFTIFSVFIFINALNMYDGSDGQLGIYSIIFLTYLAYKLNSVYYLSFILPLIFFLILNLKKKTFAGNSGSYFLGFLLSFIIVKIYNFDKKYLFCDEVVLLMFFPVIDLTRLFFYRIYNNKYPFSGDRNHLHHILYNVFQNNTKVQVTLFAISALPLIIYEIANINILYLICLNSIIYLYILKKLSFQDNK